MTLLAVPFGVTTGRRGTLYGIGLGIVLALSYWFLMSVFVASERPDCSPPLSPPGHRTSSCRPAPFIYCSRRRRKFAPHSRHETQEFKSSVVRLRSRPQVPGGLLLASARRTTSTLAY